MNNIKLKDLILLDLGEAEINFAKECLELLKEQRISDNNLRVGDEFVDFDMWKFFDKANPNDVFNECGTSCCIAGLHMLNNKSFNFGRAAKSDFSEYLAIIGIKGAYMSRLYRFALAASWHNSISFAITRLEFIVKYEKIIDIEDVDTESGCQIFVASDELCDTYSRYYMPQAEFHEMLKRFLND